MLITNKPQHIDKFTIVGEYKIDGVRNLYLRVNKSSKVFRYKGKRWLTLGSFGVDTTLRDAEMLSQIISVKLKQGFTTDQLDNTLKITKSPYDFEDNLRSVSEIKVSNPNQIPIFMDVHQKWFDFSSKKHGWTKVHKQQSMNVIKTYAYPCFGDKQIHHITRKEIAECINKVYEKGINETARKMRGKLEAIFEFAIDREWLENNPTPPPKSTLIIGKKNRAVPHGYLKFEKIPEIVEKLLAKNTPQSLATIISLITSKRVKEVCEMKWKDIHFKEKQWNAPSETTKNRLPHHIPLTNLFTKVLEARKGIDDSEYVFTYKGKSVNKEAPRLQLQGLIKHDLNEYQHINSERKPDAHGFRHSFKTWAEMCGYAKHFISNQQSHAKDGSVPEMYNQYDYLEERRVLAQHWEDFCLGKSLIEEKARNIS